MTEKQMTEKQKEEQARWGAMLSYLTPLRGGVTAPQGFKASGVKAEIRYSNRRDLALIYSETPAAAAALYTRNRVQAAPIAVTREHLQKGGRLRAAVINAGVANAGTGAQGVEDARQMARWTAEFLKIAPEEVAVASTGVIGMRLPMEKIRRGIYEAVQALSEDGGGDAARAIMTTDTRPKEAAVSFEWGGRTVTLGAMAKGAGMMHPNLATMLVFVTTDAAVEDAFLPAALTAAADRSVNMLSIDGDTSTNDMVLIMANGQAGNPLITADSGGERFLRALEYLLVKLTREMARDGEGATRLIEVEVVNAASESDARLAARTIVSSSLVKTAVHGRDPNWGRVLAALGYSGAEFDPEKVDIYFGKVCVAAGGCEQPFSEEEVRELLGEDEVRITVDLHAGTARAFAWGCDLSPDYVHINASYRS